MKFILTHASWFGHSQDVKPAFDKAIWDSQQQVWTIQVSTVWDMTQLLKAGFQLILNYADDDEYTSETLAKYTYEITVYDAYVE